MALLLRYLSYYPPPRTPNPPPLTLPDKLEQVTSLSGKVSGGGDLGFGEEGNKISWGFLSIVLPLFKKKLTKIVHYKQVS